MNLIIENNFAPDLIVEVTNQCDKHCSGCYAPNVFVKGPSSPISRVKNLTLMALEQAWIAHVQLSSTKIISVRGGEPTLNPEIVKILHFLKSKSTEVYLETHGEWELVYS